MSDDEKIKLLIMIIKNLMISINESGVTSDLQSVLDDINPDRKHLNGQPISKTTKMARRYMNEAKAALDAVGSYNE